ncbi:MAG: hypothetical protein J6M90_02760 [Oscillospiraceae bacterium]|nr:hypothetical protein [Oscillospiraceae bacterium]MBQ4256087.1 hypothetical protein [Oscillospiraceae bacterium]MBQ9209833.1 hypothetical protein [Oscillospiraceae bacterium]MBR4346819.1 hypothetical protein [Oscillospiraceae bacterium]
MNEMDMRKAYDPRKLFKASVPVFVALFLFLASAAYIIFRMVSNYTYNERWKDYDDCGV